MSENSPQFNNLAHKVKNVSKIQVLKEYLASLFGVKILDKNFLNSLQKIEQVSENVKNILEK